MKKRLNYSLKRQSGGSGFFCGLTITIEPKPDLKNHIIEDISVDNYGNRLFRHDFFAAFIGLNYALKRITTNEFYDIKIIKTSIFVVDFFPLLMAYSASRVLLNHFENNETEEEFQTIENEIFVKLNRTLDGFFVFKNRSQLLRKSFLKKQETILNWQPFDWHKDWTDNYIEFEILQSASFRLLPIFIDYDFRLNSFEEGYQLVELWKNNQKWMEIQVSDVKEQIAVIHTPEFDEVYFDLKFYFYFK